MKTARIRVWTTVFGSVALSTLALAACGGDDDPGPSAGRGGSAAIGGSGATGGSGGSAATGGSGGGAGDAGEASCGNAVREGGEECDDGNTIVGDGCENSCTFSCVEGTTRDTCSDGNACNGAEVCGADHVCQAGTPVAEGTPCGTGRVCVAGACVDASCGDGQVQSGEECDDGNVTAGDGCEANCTFSCVSGDTSRNCSAADECAGPSSCNDTTHTCSPRTALDNDTACNSAAGYCKDGVCTTPVCGNRTPEPGEQCDDGNTDDADGCKSDCSFSCTSAADCNDSNVCTADVCSGSHTCDHPADTTRNGMDCSVGGVSGSCDNGTCRPPSCGNGTVDGGEECDNGAENGQTGNGCTASCQFECDGAVDCDDANACTGTETCIDVTGGKTCQAGAPLGQGAVCLASPRRICDASAQCVLSTCGDGYLDAAAGEQCEPPNTPTCSATCQGITAPVCGNGTIDSGEQCDDGNTLNVDGCDSACQYEMWMRMNMVRIMRGAAPSFCTPTTNRLGQLLTQIAADQLNTSLQDGITAGSTNIMVQALGLDDLTGVADPSFELGVSSGRPDPAKGSWVSDPLDWWFLLDPNTLGATNLPTSRMPASLAARQLNAGPSEINLSLLLAGSPATLQLLDTRTRGRTGTVTSVPAPPPSALSPGLVTAETISALASNQEGLCGSVTVESLSKIPAPQVLTTGGSFACQSNCSSSRAYTYCGDGQPVGPGCNSLLDVLVGGCQVRVLICVNAISPGQPDVVNGGPTPLTLGTGNKVPDSQTTGNRNAYSAFFEFTTKRQHATGIQ